MQTRNLIVIALGAIVAYGMIFPEGIRFGSSDAQNTSRVEWETVLVGHEFVDLTQGGTRALIWDYARPGSGDCVRIYDANRRHLGDDCEGDSQYVDHRGQGQIFFVSGQESPVTLKYRVLAR